ncbi:dephospho-CoA kinase [Candidatus Xianfuyuplasma coldseepsis]|uniref:Dephospho-CoA kinase n=1 Tax=Candidatus Xianfuyuplasma coldseepsis TaxID=2782163 RepID=A0A7L7KUU8_9MOLU|nr:dephospho-CoA kinase [Xianfuyuplasma coldseepsis]QMS85548.1 dephospho-CoA kinase [Xianfuyuplasma coldseepsis]
MTRIIGLTGGIASGKSTVSTMFKEAGIPVIDTDQIAHDLYQKGTTVYDAIVNHFTSDILLTDQSINRKKLGQIIFANKTKRDELNQIVHPEVYHVVDAEIERYKELDEPIVVVDIPLLFETGYDKECDATVVVYTNYENQIERLISRDQIDRDYAAMKIDAQLSLDAKKEQATYVIDNSFSILDTKRDFNHVLEQLEVK